jgi:hypothetical protein
MTLRISSTLVRIPVKQERAFSDSIFRRDTHH